VASIGFAVVWLTFGVSMIACCCAETPVADVVEVQAPDKDYKDEKATLVQPEPALAEEPKPAVEEPKPVVEEPAPVVEEPAPEKAPPPPEAVPDPKPVADGKVEFGFYNEEGKIQNFRFGTKPLGMNFDVDKMPIRIKSFGKGSHAQECGVEVGMILATIEGESLRDKTYREAWTKIGETLKNLPAKQA